MKVGKHHWWKFLILTLIAVILAGVCPVLAAKHYSRMAIKQGISQFNRQAVVRDSLFAGPFSARIPLEAADFPYSRLRSLAQELGLDPEREIARISEPFGTPWIYIANSRIITQLIDNLYHALHLGHLDALRIYFWLTLLGFLVFLTVQSRWKYKYPVSDEQLPSPSVTNRCYTLLMFVITCCLSVQLLLAVLNYGPDFSRYIAENSDYKLYLASVVFLLLILYVGVLSLSVIHLIRLAGRRHKTMNHWLEGSWTALFLVLIFSVNFSGNQLRSMASSLRIWQQFNYRNQVNTNCLEICARARQWYKIYDDNKYRKWDEIDLPALSMSSEDRYGYYRLTESGRMLKVHGESKYRLDSGELAKVICTYDPLADSLAVELIPEYIITGDRP